MLTSVDLAELTAIDESTMTDTATVSRPTMVDDGAGGQTQTYANVATNVPCRLNRSGTQPTETATADQIQNAADWLIFVPVGTDVRNADRIIIDGRTFEVAKAYDHTWQTSLRVLAVEIT